MNDTDHKLGKAVADEVALALTRMREQDPDATSRLVKQLEAGQARLIISCEIFPEFVCSMTYYGPSGERGEIYRLAGTETAH